MSLPDVALSESPRHAETLNMLLIAELVIAAALERRESRGSHWRLDYQFLDENQARRHFAFRPLNIDTNGLLESQEEVITMSKAL